MGERLDNLPEDLYAEHKDLARELGDAKIKRNEQFLSPAQDEALARARNEIDFIRNDVFRMLQSDIEEVKRFGEIIKPVVNSVRSRIDNLRHDSLEAQRAMSEIPEVEKKYRQNIELAGAHKDIHYEEYVDQAKKEAAERGIHIDTQDNPDDQPGDSEK